MFVKQLKSLLHTVFIQSFFIYFFLFLPVSSSGIDRN